MRNSLFNEKLNTTLKSFLFLIFGVILMALCCMNTITPRAATVDDRIDHFIYQDPKPEKVVYLTFDDGPSKYTLDILNLFPTYIVFKLVLSINIPSIVVTLDVSKLLISNIGILVVENIQLILVVLLVSKLLKSTVVIFE